ncbi:MAG: glutathione S-transferase [Myxococcota bacterium]
MLTVYHAPRTRSVRILWLLEELGTPYRLQKVEFVPPAKGFFSQKTPLGKLPVIEDGEVVMAKDAEALPQVIEDARGRAHSALDFLESSLGGDAYLLGSEFSAADIMAGFSLAVARTVDVLGDHPLLGQYLARLEERPAFQRAASA